MLNKRATCKSCGAGFLVDGSVLTECESKDIPPFKQQRWPERAEFEIPKPESTVTKPVESNVPVEKSKPIPPQPPVQNRFVLFSSLAVITLCFFVGVLYLLVGGTGKQEQASLPAAEIQATVPKIVENPVTVDPEQVFKDELVKELRKIEDDVNRQILVQSIVNAKMASSEIGKWAALWPLVRQNAKTTTVIEHGESPTQIAMILAENPFSWSMASARRKTNDPTLDGGLRAEVAFFISNVPFGPLKNVFPDMMDHLEGSNGLICWASQETTVDGWSTSSILFRLRSEDSVESVSNDDPLQAPLPKAERITRFHIETIYQNGAKQTKQLKTQAMAPLLQKQQEIWSWRTSISPPSQPKTSKNKNIGKRMNEDKAAQAEYRRELQEYEQKKAELSESRKAEQKQLDKEIKALEESFPKWLFPTMNFNLRTSRSGDCALFAQYVAPSTKPAYASFAYLGPRKSDASPVFFGANTTLVFQSFPKIEMEKGTKYTLDKPMMMTGVLGDSFIIFRFLEKDEIQEIKDYVDAQLNDSIAFEWL